MIITETLHTVKCDSCKKLSTDVESLSSALEVATNHIEEYTENEGSENLWHKVIITPRISVRSTR